MTKYEEKVKEYFFCYLDNTKYSKEYCSGCFFCEECEEECKSHIEKIEKGA